MKEDLNQIAKTMISQYGDEASVIAMMRAAEFAAANNQEEWIMWEKIIKIIESYNVKPDLDS
tara:strand:- start:2460 stop:2645 length:186 start_codon:yes stop_codon:yes gene_type:complete